jgi:hypothetical protein
MLLDKAVDGCLQIYDGLKDAVSQPPPCELDTSNNLWRLTG